MSIMPKSLRDRTRLNFYLSVNLKVSSFDLILCLEYLMKILQFVSVPEDESASKPITPNPAATTTVSKSTRLIFPTSFVEFHLMNPFQKWSQSRQM